MHAALLTPVQEQALTAAWCDNADESAMHRLVTAHKPLVEKIARQHKSFGYSTEDLVAEGIVGMLKAAHRFDPSRGVRFSTYAQFWIKEAMQNFMLKNRSVVRPAFSYRVAQNYQPLRNTISLDEPIPGTDLCYADAIEAPNVDIDGFIDTVRAKQRLRTAVKKLPERERYIIRARYLSDEPASMADIAEHYGISKQRVQQLESRAKKKLRAMLSQAKMREVA